LGDIRGAKMDFCTSRLHVWLLERLGILGESHAALGLALAEHLGAINLEMCWRRAGGKYGSELNMACEEIRFRSREMRQEW
jgi:hypothetical protein